MFMTLQLKNNFKTDGSSTQLLSFHQILDKHSIKLQTAILQNFTVFQLWPYYFKCANVKKKSTILGRRHDLRKKS